MSDNQRSPLVPGTSKGQRTVGWWNPDQVYNNLHFLLAQNQASYATHLFITHPRARKGLLGALGIGAGTDVFADGISVVYKWLKKQHEEGELPFSFEQLWHALLPILRGSQQRKALDAQMERRKQSQTQRTPSQTSVYPQIGSSQQKAPEENVDVIRDRLRQAGHLPDSATSLPRARQAALEGHNQDTSGAAKRRRVRGSQSKYYTGNFPRVESIGPVAASTQNTAPGSDAWFREQSGSAPEERFAQQNTPIPRQPKQVSHQTPLPRSQPTGQFPSIGSSRGGRDPYNPYQANPTGQFPSIGSAVQRNQRNHPNHPMGGAPRLISQVPGFQFGHGGQQPMNPYAQSQVQAQSTPSGVYHQAHRPAPQSRQPSTPQTQAPVARRQHRRAEPPTRTARQPSPTVSPSPSPKPKRRAASERQAEPIGPARRKRRQPTGPTTEMPNMGGAAPRPARRSSAKASRPRSVTGQVEHIGVPTHSAKRQPAASSAQLQAKPHKSRLLSRYPLDNTALHWDEHRIFNVLSLRILQEEQSSELLTFIEDADNTTSLMQALNEAAQIAHPGKAVEELYHWFIYTTYEKRLEWPAHRFWRVLQSLLLESIEKNKRNQPARDAASTNIALNNLDSATPGLKPSVSTPSGNNRFLPIAAPAAPTPPPASKPAAQPAQPAGDDEPLLFDEPVLLEQQQRREAHQQLIIDILADVDTIEIK